MGFDMLFQVLGALERLSAEVALMRLQGDMDPDMGRNVVALDRRGPTASPLTG